MLGFYNTNAINMPESVVRILLFNTGEMVRKAREREEE